MIAKLIHKNDYYYCSECRNDYYYCSECRMKQSKIIESYCFFCGSTFSNYEEELIKAFNEEEEQLNG